MKAHVKVPAKMFEVVEFNNGKFGIMQSVTGKFAGDGEGKPKTFKKKGAAVLLCDEMNAKVTAKRAQMTKEN